MSRRSTNREEIHQEVAKASVVTTKVERTVDGAPELEQPSYIMPSETVIGKPQPSLPMPQPPVKRRSSQTAFDFDWSKSKEVMVQRLNMEDRDHNRLNQDLKTQFLEIFAEPDSQYHSVACVWTNSYRVFEITRIYSYKILTLILGLPIAFLAGFIFALFSFVRIWIAQPTFAIVRIALAQLLTIWPTFLIYIVRPFFYSVGAVFSTFRIHRSDGPVIREVWENV